MSETPRPRPWRRRALYLVYVTVVVVLLLEGALRIASEETGGRLRTLNLELVPFPAVSEAHRKILLTDPADLPYVIPDPNLGWTIRPLGRTADGLFASNEAGLRSAPTLVQDEKTAGVHRVLLLGDSYTHGDEVPWAETWAAHLQADLGPTFEVLNGAVGGYGTDQAILRGRQLTPRFQPDTVILGIYREDLLRNLTVFRAIKHPYTNYPWSKPRFVLDDADPAEIRLVNHPVLAWPPARVLDVLENYDRFPELQRFDRLYSPSIYAHSAWYHSRLVRLVCSKKIHRDRYEDRESLLREQGEGVILAARLARLFEREQRAAGRRTLVLLLPGVGEVPGYRPGGHPPARHLAAELDRLGVTHFDVGPALWSDLKTGEDASVLFVRGVGHPNDRANRIIAREIQHQLR